MQRRWPASLSRCTRSSAALPSRNCASQTQLARTGEWIDAADHGRRGDLRSRQHEGETENPSLPTQLRARGVLPPPGLRSSRTLSRGKRSPTTTPQQRAHPGFPRRAFGRCGSCGQGLIGRWSNARGHLSTEVALGEGATRTRFHITLEIDRPLLVGKFDADVKQPGALSLGVGGAEQLHDSVVNVIL
jgi:hypothetical protein